MIQARHAPDTPDAPKIDLTHSNQYEVVKLCGGVRHS